MIVDSPMEYCNKQITGVNIEEKNENDINNKEMPLTNNDISDVYFSNEFIQNY